MNRATIRGLVCAAHIGPAWTFGDWLAVYAYAVRPLVRDGIAVGHLPDHRGLWLRCPVTWPDGDRGHVSTNLCPEGSGVIVAYPGMPVVSGPPFINLDYGRTRASAPVAKALVSADAALANGRLREGCPAAAKLLERLHLLASEASAVRIGETLAGLSFSPAPTRCP